MTVVETALGEPIVVSREERRPVRVIRRVLRNQRVKVGLAMLLPLVALAILHPVLPFRSTTATALVERLETPNLKHPFGTDSIGRDVLSRTISGLRISLVVGLTVAALCLSIGIVFGTIAGYRGGAVDSVISAITNIFLSFPGALKALLLISAVGPGVWQVVVALTIANGPRAIRLQRSSVLAIRGRPYIDAARQCAAKPVWILVRHVIPNTLSPMLVVASIYAADAILIEATLSFLGLGIVPPDSSLGTMIKDGEPYLQEAWWITMIPAGLLVAVAISLHLIADGVREVIDPSERGGRR